MMRRLAIPVSVFVVLLLGVVIGRPSLGPVAQVRAQDAATLHPVVGAWVADTDANDPENAPSLFIFHADGTYLQSDPDGSNGVGVWEATDAQNATLTAIFHAQDEMGNFGGGAMLRASVAVDETGNSLTAEYTIEFVGPDGMASGEMGPGAATAERIVVEAMGTPTAPMMEMEESGTPAAG